MNTPGVREELRSFRGENFSRDSQLPVRTREFYRGANFPIRLDAVAHPVLLREFGAGQGPPKFVRRCFDVAYIKEFLVTHFVLLTLFASSFCFKESSACAR